MTASRYLGTLLIAGLICANVLVLALSGYSLHQSRSQYELHAQTMAQNIASALDQNVSSNIAKIDLAVRVVADELERQLAGKGIDEKTMNNFLAKYEQRLPEIEGFQASNADGLIIIGNGVSNADRVSAADREYFVYHRDNVDGKLQITKPLWGSVVKHHVILFARRYNYPNGRFAGIVYATIGIDHFTQLLSQFDLGPKGSIILRDADLGLIIRFPFNPDRPVGKVGNNKVSKELHLAFESGARSATFRTPVGSDGLQRIFAFRRLEKAPMVIIAGVASADYLADWTAEVYKTSALAFGFLLMSLLAGGFLLRLLNQTVRESTRNQIYLQNASDGIQILDGAGKLVEVNNRFCAMLGYDRGELFRMKVTDWVVGWTPKVLLRDIFPTLLASPASSTFETQLRRKDGAILDVEVNASNFKLDGKRYLYASIRDIVERKQAIEKIRHLAYFDSLTELPNRRLLMDRLGQALIASNRSQEFGALMILDLDNFKVLNDTQGHGVGDCLLIEVARRVHASVRQEDTVARLGGDEYVVMMENLGPDETLAASRAEGIAEKIRRALNQPYTITHDDQLHHSTASIGLALFRGQELSSVDVLLKQADVALYQAKGAGRNAIRFFNPEMQEAINSRSAMEAALRNALQQGEFQLFYQPQIDQDGLLIGAEALLRWLSANQAPVSPLQFIPLAEDTGLIIPMGLWVMQTACAQLSAWAENPCTRDLQIAINVSARQFRQADFVEQVRESLHRVGANPALLKLELTESVVLENVEDVIIRMQQIKGLGVTFSLDDFGIGFSSLSYLKRLPLDQVKIDQSFVRDITSDPNDAAIVRAIIAIGKSLGMEVIAEGVETEAQLRFLKESGCLKYQGYLFGKPMPIAEWERYSTGITARLLGGTD